MEWLRCRRDVRSKFYRAKEQGAGISACLACQRRGRGIRSPAEVLSLALLGHSRRGQEEKLNGRNTSAAWIKFEGLRTRSWARSRRGLHGNTAVKADAQPNQACENKEVAVERAEN